MFSECFQKGKDKQQDKVSDKAGNDGYREDFESFKARCCKADAYWKPFEVMVDYASVREYEYGKDKKDYRQVFYNPLARRRESLREVL